MNATNVAGCNALNRQRVAVLVGVEDVAASGTDRCDVAADGIGVGSGHAFTHRCRVGVGNGQAVNVDDDAAGGAEASAVALVLPGAGRATTRDVAVLIVDRHVERDGVVAQATRCGNGVVVSNAIQRFLHKRSGGAAVKGKGQHATTVGVGADGGTRDDRVARSGNDGRQVESVGKHIIAARRALALDGQRGTAPVVALGRQLPIEKCSVTVNADATA